MKKLIFSLSLMALLFSANAKPAADTVRIGSYNLRMQHLDKNTPDKWEYRHARCVQSIYDNKFDIFGVQELADFAIDELTQDFKDSYKSVFFSPYSQDGIGGKACGVFYNKKRFKLLEYHYFWICDTPFEKTENDHYTKKGKKGSYIRGGQCLLFKDKYTGKKIFFLNHHGILNKKENQQYAPVFEEMEKRYNPKGYPSFFVGDFNARVDAPAHQIYRQYWSDSADITGERPCTMNSFKIDPQTWDKQRHIDFIYYRNTGAPVTYEVNQTLYDGRCASDHFPVWADFIIH